MNPGDSPLYDYLRLMLVLSGVLALAWVALRYWLPKIAPAGASGDLLDVVERKQLDARNSLFVVKAGSKYLLLGSSEHGLTLLEQLDGDEVRAAVLQRPRPALFAEIFALKAKGKS